MDEVPISHAHVKEGGSMREHGALPRARKDGLLKETVGEELLLYDRDSHTAHCLSPIAACVWRHCDGERDVSELVELIGASENLVVDALHELREKDLLAAEPPMQSTVPGISRREAIGRAVGIGAAAAAAPLIVSATAATPAMASSGESCGNCRTEGCCRMADAVCCCCNNGQVFTQSTGFNCTAICAAGSRGGVFKETTGMEGI
jgi:hypothetical protein